MRNIKEIIIHCSDSDIKSHDNLETIRNWHIARGWADIGYHYVITKDGEVHVGRPLQQVGAHCKGRNKESIGICLTGKSKFTPSQFISLGIVCKELMDAFGLQLNDIFPHRKFSEFKTCPNFDCFLFDKSES